MSTPIRIISSMATKQILTDLVAKYQAATGQTASIESVGGVDAAKRVQAGEAFDLVVLARDALDKLMAGGQLQPGSLRDLVRSGVAVAVRSGTPHPDISTEVAVKQAVMGAATLGYSTGPSGVQLAKLFERWGIVEAVKSRIVTPPPGVPVGSLIAKGEVALGFQQLSELLNVPGIDRLGMLPLGIEIITTFSGAVASTCADIPAALALLDFMKSPAAAGTIGHNGMSPA
jgi:molybdate transport system substrate-binding protein